MLQQETKNPEEEKNKSRPKHRKMAEIFGSPPIPRKQKTEENEGIITPNSNKEPKGAVASPFASRRRMSPNDYSSLKSPLRSSSFTSTTFSPKQASTFSTIRFKIENDVNFTKQKINEKKLLEDITNSKNDKTLIIENDKKPDSISYLVFCCAFLPKEQKAVLDKYIILLQLNGSTAICTAVNNETGKLEPAKFEAGKPINDKKLEDFLEGHYSPQTRHRTEKEKPQETQI